MTGASDLGVGTAVSIALGGMIGGGIYAVLGVVAQITGPATWFAFVLAGVVAMAAAYSYLRLNRLTDSSGGSVTFVQGFTGNSTLAGMVGWTLLLGYVGSMAMYAYAFGEFTVGFAAVPEGVGGVALRPVVSVLVVAGFVALNLLGARASGSAENVLVAAKVAVLVLFGVGGLAYAVAVGPQPVRLGIDRIAGLSFGPAMAAAVSFVAFQGWQLLFYDQESLADAQRTIARAIAVAIPVAVAIYVLVAVATYNLAPRAIETHPHVALASAAETMLGGVAPAGVGFTIISLSALFSTGSAINATLFSSGYLAKGMVSDDLLPDRVGDASVSGVPERTLVWLGAVTAGLTVVGSLEAITAFASLAFIVVFGAMSYLALRHRDYGSINPLVPAVGAVGAAAFFPLMFYHLYRAERATFYAVFVLAGAVLLLEVLYFEREVLEREVERLDYGPTEWRWGDDSPRRGR